MCSKISLICTRWPIVCYCQVFLLWFGLDWCLNDLLKDAIHRDFDMGEHVFKGHDFLVAVDDIGIGNLRMDCLEIITRYHLQVGELQAIWWGVENIMSDGHFFPFLSYVIHISSIDYFCLRCLTPLCNACITCVWHIIMEIQTQIFFQQFLWKFEFFRFFNSFSLTEIGERFILQVRVWYKTRKITFSHVKMTMNLQQDFIIKFTSVLSAVWRYNCKSKYQKSFGWD